MARPFQLSGYRGLWSRPPPPAIVPPGPRPDRPTAWFHATSDRQAAALIDLAERLTAQRPDIPVLLSFDSRRLTGPRPARHSGTLYEIPLDSDHPGLAPQFLDHWRPAVALWTGGYLKPNLLLAAKARGVPMMLADLDEAALGREHLPWMPDPERGALRSFDRIFALNIATFSRLQRLGVAASSLQVAPPLQDSLSPPLCAEDDLIETGERLAGRPVWHAAGLCRSEAKDLIAAHRHAARLAHRLLLVITPAPTLDDTTLTAMLTGAGLRHCHWDPGDPIDEFTQVLVTRDPDSPALWFRLAPVSVIGGTLSPDERPAVHPFLPAALGSAVLHGPHIEAHAPAYDRLAAAGGCRLVRGVRPLGEALLDIIQPEEAARMALAGWDTVTEGAWLIDHLLDIVQELYTSHASA